MNAEIGRLFFVDGAVFYLRTLRGGVSNRRRLIELEAEIADHLVRVGGFLAGCRQVAVDEDRIRRVEAHRLQRAQVYFSAAGDANLFVRIDEAKQAKSFQALLRRKLVSARKVSWDRS